MRMFCLMAAGLAIVYLGTSRSGAAAGRDWAVFGGDEANSQYSSLDQINRGNVSRLEVAWIYHCGDAREDNRSQIQCNPLVVDEVLYGTSPQLKAIALNAATGELIWAFDPFASGESSSSLGVNRGLVYWKEERGEEKGKGARLLYTAGQSLFCLEAETGRLVETFGNRGRVDLRAGLGRDAGDLHVLSNTPGVVYEDLLILGTRVAEGPGPSAPGHIRAYDVRTGEIRWIFHTIPHPGELGYETWPPDAWQYSGGGNAWSGISLDRERGWVFLPTGSPAFDFWGGDRQGANLFGNCLLVLDARTGTRVWHYQFVHHDLWDRDLPAAPNLPTVQRDGERVEAVAQITKSGHVFVFDRQTGKPLFPIEEQPVPPSDLRGEEAWPTQPLPLQPPPFSRQQLTEENVTAISEQSREAVLERLRQVRTGRPFIPPSTAGTVIFPGFDGGAEWGGAAHDPDGILYVNSNEMPWILTMVDLAEKESRMEGRSLGERVYRLNCAACHGLDRMGDAVRTFPPLVGVEERLKEADARALLDEGKGLMPSFGFLSEAEKGAVLQYVFGQAPLQKGADPLEEEISGGKIPYAHTGYNRFLDPEGYPAVKPPWGQLNAIDLNAGVILWQVPLGEFDELTERGIPQTGTENYGGPVLTAGGLIFIGASKDEKFRVFDQETGKVLWEWKLPAGGYATPATYMAEGKQYVVIAAGGGKMGTKSGDAYVAFALREAGE